MLDNSTRKVAIIIDGRLVCNVRGHKDLFGGDDSPKVKALEQKVDAARREQTDIRQKYVLRAFRAAIAEFIGETDVKPTFCLMSYRDMDLLCDAYNAEKREQQIDRPDIETYSSYDDRRRIDGVRIKQGCDSKDGSLRFYSSEGC